MISYPCERISLLSSVFLSSTSSEMIPGVSNLFLIQSPSQKVQVHQNKLIRKLSVFRSSSKSYDGKAVIFLKKYYVTKWENKNS